MNRYDMTLDGTEKLKDETASMEVTETAAGQFQRLFIENPTGLKATLLSQTGKMQSLFLPYPAKVYSIRITVNSIRNDGTTRKDPGNGGKPRKIKGFSELMKRGGTRIDTFFEKRAHFSEQKEKLSTLSTKRAGKPHKQRVPGSFLNWNE